MLGVQEGTQRPQQPEVITWRDLANCKGVNEIFFPWHVGKKIGRRSKDEEDAAIPAKRVCANCLVQKECLDWAIEHSQVNGIWGGMTPIERKNEIKRRRNVK